MNDLETRLKKLIDGWLDSSLDMIQSASPLESAQFTVDDVIAATGVTPSQLHNWSTRDWGFQFAMGNPGKGRRRLFSALDVVTVAVADVLSPFSMVQVAAQWSRAYWIKSRLLVLFGEPIDRIGLVYRVAWMRSADRTAGDWCYVPEDGEDSGRLGTGYIRLEFDRLIIETLENLLAILNDEPLPKRDLLQPPTADETKVQTDDFFGARDVDSEGRDVRTGLTYDETAELEKLESHGKYVTRAQQLRLTELQAKHHNASRLKVAADMAKRFRSE